MGAARYPLTIEQGATFTLDLTVSDADGAAINLTGYSAAMQGREQLDDVVTVFDLASGSEITLGSDGSIAVVIDDTATAAITATSGVYDLIITSGGGVVTRVLQGTFTVSPQVTR
jgi:hypothetical protein